MKKITVVMLTALLLITTVGSFNVFAAELPSTWSRSLGFETGEVIERFTVIGTAGNVNLKDNSASKGSNTNDHFIVIDGAGVTATAGGKYAFSSEKNHTAGVENGRSLKITAGTSDMNLFFATTNFTNVTPVTNRYAGSAVTSALTAIRTENASSTSPALDDRGAYNDCHIFEMSYYVNFASFASTAISGTTNMGFRNMPGMNFLNDNNNRSIPTETRTTIDIGKRLFHNNTTDNKYLETDTWYQIKNVYNFDTDTVYTYFDGELIGTYTSADNREIGRARDTNITIGAGTVVYIDDIRCDPKNGEGITKGLADSSTTFYVGGSETTEMSAGAVTADVNLYNDFSEKNVTLATAVYGNDRKELKSAHLQVVSLKDYMERKINLNFGSLAATDAVKVMYLDDISTIKPIKSADSLE